MAHMYSGRFPPATLGLKAERIDGAVSERPLQLNTENGLLVLRAIATVIEPALPKNSGVKVSGIAGGTARPIGRSFLISGKKLSYP